MKTLMLFLGLLLTSVSMNAQQSINGIWNTGQDNTTIEINSSTGKIHSSNNEKATIGKLIVKDLNKIDNAYKGKLYIIKKKRWVDVEFVPNGNSLTVTISKGWQSKTLMWNLVEKL
ncbi:MAG: hypothetical protein COW03_07335 [Cytophagales bacterium CG12_big_fil_rev_8_21_14_0_65_40_12]|nr:MAG: hypothetical protein COW03_07335 [Cytophagales bacterium CG12_big_fil_rev_8_21_14_0_65_40_12]PIW03652.1 MAG: hypothetical protein COW40_13680 [Cytophagales bacterium CG17_big_fil_post_rev_8_21_14_2_50_40_13]